VARTETARTILVENNITVKDFGSGK